MDSGGDYFIQIKCDVLVEIIDSISKNINHPNILDAGCGIGDFERLLPETNGKVIGVDISEEMINVANNYNAKGRAEFKVCDVRDLPYPDHSMNLTFISCVLHHLNENDMLSTLKELCRVTAEDGLIVCFEHNPYNPLTQLVVKMTPLDQGAKLITADKMVELYEQAGMKVLDTQYLLFGTKPIDRWINQHFKTKIRRLPLGGQYCIVGR